MILSNLGISGQQLQALSAVVKINTQVTMLASGIDTLNTLINVVFWIVRLSILLVLLPTVKKMVEAKAEEDSRGEQKAMQTLVFVVVAFAATFFIDDLVTDWIADNGDPTVATTE